MTSAKIQSAPAPAQSPIYHPLASVASVAATGAAGDDSGGSNLAMILSALLIAVTIMGIMAFCVWMCGCGPEDAVRGVRYANGSRVGVAGHGIKTAQAGMSKIAIDKLPATDYECLRLQRGDLGCCSVCLSEFTSEDKSIRVLPVCAHLFHPECISMWLFSHSSCPICRQSLLLPPPQRSCKHCGKLSQSRSVNFSAGGGSSCNSGESDSPAAAGRSAAGPTGGGGIQLHEVVVDRS